MLHRQAGRGTAVDVPWKVLPMKKNVAFINALLDFSDAIRNGSGKSGYLACLRNARRDIQYGIGTRLELENGEAVPLSMIHEEVQAGLARFRNAVEYLREVFIQERSGLRFVQISELSSTSTREGGMICMVNVPINLLELHESGTVKPRIAMFKQTMKDSYGLSHGMLRDVRRVQAYFFQRLRYFYQSTPAKIRCDTHLIALLVLQNPELGSLSFSLSPRVKKAIPDDEKYSPRSRWRRIACETLIELFTLSATADKELFLHLVAIALSVKEDTMFDVVLPALAVGLIANDTYLAHVMTFMAVCNMNDEMEAITVAMADAGNKPPNRYEDKLAKIFGERWYKSVASALVVSALDSCGAVGSFILKFEHSVDKVCRDPSKLSSFFQ